jgi:hypothetical protein
LKPEIEGKKATKLGSAVARLEGMKSADREKLKAEIDTTIAVLSGEISDWATTAGLPVRDFSDVAVQAALEREAEEAAERVWQDRKRETQRRLEAHAASIQLLDPDAQLKYRGSLAKGRKGVSKGFAEFDPMDFDVDFFVQSDKLYLEVPGLAPDAPGEVWADRHPRLRAMMPEMAAAYDAITGVRQGKFSLKLRAKKNVQELLAKRGLPEFAGETHVEITPPPPPPPPPEPAP